MTVDISGLTLQETQPLDWENYKDSQESAPPPPKGRYICRVPEAAAMVFGATREGNLSVQVDPTIVGPASEGYVIKYNRLSAKPFKRGNATVSQIGDFLRAVGSTARPKTPQEIADAVAATAGQTFAIDLDWEAYDSATGYRVKGMENFPPSDGGGHQPFVKSGAATPGEEPATLRANARISRYIAQGK